LLIRLRPPVVFISHSSKDKWIADAICKQLESAGIRCWIANALGAANVLEGTVRRNGNRVRVSIELIDARHDKTTWADSFDRDLTDIFAIQSEVAQTVATKLAATLSPEEKQNIQKKPTENLDAYDLYLGAKELLVSLRASSAFGSSEQPLVDAIGFLEQAIRLDPKFTLAYCESAEAHDLLAN
jgi:TIR domain-containing protein